jgi:UDP-GlcNAc:undecaprenyl-phosphate/decaprenyl-phosphate GlcNAc-1-phosphate transferase
MYSIIFLGGVSFLLSLVLTPVVRNLFRRWEVVDHPDASLKVHKEPVPRVGGIAIALSYVTSFGLLLLVGLNGGTFVQGGFSVAVRLLPAVALIFGVGLFDDLFGLKPWQKFIGQILAASVTYLAGIHVDAFGGYYFSSWWSFPATVFWLVLCTNAVNLIDGLDGLAAGVGLFAAVTMSLAALLQDNFTLASATVPLAGCLLGFLRYNFSPATIFLGDSGSLLVGFLLGCYGILWSQKSATILGMAAPLLALSIPLLDTVLAIARRFLRREPIFSGDRRHIHHRLLDRGLSPREVALVLYAVCGVGAISSLLIANRKLTALTIPLICGIAWIGIQYLGYIEFGVAGRMFANGTFRRILSLQITLQNYEEELIAAQTPEGCWDTIERAGRELGFEYVRLILPERQFHYLGQINSGILCEVQVAISDEASLEIAARSGDASHAHGLVPFAEMMGRVASQSALTAIKDKRSLQRAAAGK